MPQHDPVVNPSVHYLGVEGETTLWGDHSQCEAQWRRIQSERSDEYGPLGAYNFGGCNSHGIRMVGRGWDMDSAANGGENGIWYNAGSRALCILVGTEDVITPQCQEMIRVFANEAVDEHGMQWPLRGHSEFVATSCPGDHLRAVITNINADPAPVPAPPDDLSFLNLLLEDDMYSVVSGSTPNTPIFQVWFRPNDGLVVKREIPATAGPLVVRDLTMGVAKAASVDGSNFKPFVVNQEVFDHIPKVS